MGRRYAQLGVEERRRIERWRAAKVSPTEMAGVAGRHRSAIVRELARNHFVDRDMPKVVGCFAMAAQLQMSDRRARQRRLVRHANLRRRVEERIKSGWTPEQIAGRMRLEDVQPRVCQETICRHVYGREGMRGELWWHLPNHRMARRPRRARKRLPPKFGRERSILLRPEAVAHRNGFGHWEGDLVVRAATRPHRGHGPPSLQQRFGQADVPSPMERVSRFTVIVKNTTKRSVLVMDKIIAAIGAVPLPARHSIAFDRGSGFVTWPRLQAQTGTRSWLGRSAVAASEGRRREQRPPRQALAAARDGHPLEDRRRHPGHHRPDECYAPQMPRMANPGRGLRRDHGGGGQEAELPKQPAKDAPHVALTGRAVPCPRSPTPSPPPRGSATDERACAARRRCVRG